MFPSVELTFIHGSGLALRMGTPKEALNMAQKLAKDELNKLMAGKPIPADARTIFSHTLSKDTDGTWYASVIIGLSYYEH